MKKNNKPSRLSDPKEFSKAFDKMNAELDAQFGHKIGLNEKNVDYNEKATSYNVKFIKSNKTNL